MDIESLLNLEQDEPTVISFLAEHDGRLVRDGDDGSVYWIDMRPRSDPRERYVVRLGWSVYPQEPPSILFATAVGGELGVASAWPVIDGYRAPNDICKPLGAEGYGLHPEWRTGPDAWPTSGNPFLFVVDHLQFDLDNGYRGRAG